MPRMAAITRSLRPSPPVSTTTTPCSPAWTAVAASTGNHPDVALHLHHFDGAFDGRLTGRLCPCRRAPEEHEENGACTVHLRTRSRYSGSVVSAPPSVASTGIPSFLA